MPWLGSLALAPVLFPPLASARPYLYMSSFDYSGPYDTCLRQAEKVLREHGFSRDLERKESAQEKAGLVYGFRVGESMTAEIQCLQKAGITLLGVAGLDNEATWEVFEKLKKAEW